MQSHLLTELRCPYPGLRPFRPDEADLFFGRDEQIDELLERLGRSRFLAVVGESGCGKSSLILAGMIPALETGFLDSAGADWLIATMRPGSQPMRNLAAALIDSGSIAWSPECPGEDLALIEAELRRGPLGLLDALREGDSVGEARLLLVVDQFEEIFRFRSDVASRSPAVEQTVDRNEAAAFVALLLRTIREPEGRVYVVLTMRSDFLGDCALFTGLPEALNDSQFLTPRLSFDQRKAAIEGPARVEGGRVEPELTTALLNDMGSGPDQLPLMQHALMRAWTVARTQGTPPTVKLLDYIEVGRLKDALSLHGDTAYDGLRDDQKSIAERLFRTLTGGNTGKRDTRRPTKLGEVAAIAGVGPEAVAEVVDHFRGGDLNFLTPATGSLGAETVLDISHESLIRQWVRLDRWAKDEAKSAETYRLLERTASDKKQPWVGSDLEGILKWRSRENPNEVWAARYGGDFTAAMSFIEAGLERQKQQEEERRAALRHEQQVRAIKMFAGGAVVVVVLTVSLAIWALRQSAIAQEARLEATKSAEDARQQSLRAAQSAEAARASEIKADQGRILAEKQTARTNALILASKAQNLSERYPVRSILLASEAIQTTLREKGPLNVEAENVLRRTLGTIAGTGLNLIDGEATCVRYSPDGKTLAVGSREVGGRVTFWDAATLVRLPSDPLEVPEGDVTSLAYSPDGKTLAASFGRYSRADEAAPQGGLVIWDIASRKRRSTLRVDGSAEVDSLAFSPDGNTLAAGYASTLTVDRGGVVLWDAATFKPLEGKRLEVSANRVPGIVFSPDGKRIALSYTITGRDETGGVMVWDFATREKIAGYPLELPTAIVTQLTISPDGSTIAASCVANASDRGSVGDLLGTVGRVMLWDLETGKSLAERGLDVSEGGVSGVAFSPDGKTLAASYNGSVRSGVVLWDVASRQRLVSSPLLADEGIVSDVVFRPDGKAIVTRNGAGLRVWDLTEERTGGVEPRVLNERSGLYSSNFGASPDGTWIVEARADLARAWKLPMPDSVKVEPTTLSLDGLRFPSARAIPAPDVLFDSGSRRLAIVGLRDIAVWDCVGTLEAKPRVVLHAPGEDKFHSTVLSRGARWLATRTGPAGVRMHLYDLEPDMGKPIGTEYSHILITALGKVDSGKSDSKSEVTKPSFGPKQQSPKSSTVNASAMGDGDSSRPGGTVRLLASSTTFSADGRWMASSNWGREITLWDLKTGDTSSISAPPIGPTDIIAAVAFHPKSPYLIAASLDSKDTDVLKINSWSLGGEAAKPTPDPIHQKRIKLSSKAPPRGNSELGVRLDKAVLPMLTNVLYEEHPKQEMRIEISAKAPSTTHAWLAFSPDGAVLSVLTNVTNDLLHWTDEGFDWSFRLSGTEPNPPELARIFSPDSRWLLASVHGTDTVLLSLNSKRATFNLPPGSTGVADPEAWADFSRDSRLLVTTSIDDAALVRDLGRLIRERDPDEASPPARSFPGLIPPMRLVRFDPDASQLVTGGGDGIIRVWRLDIAKLLEAAERVAGRNLTRAEWKQYFPVIPYDKTFANLPEPSEETASGPSAPAAPD